MRDNQRVGNEKQRYGQQPQRYVRRSRFDRGAEEIGDYHQQNGGENQIEEAELFAQRCGFGFGVGSGEERRAGCGGQLVGGASFVVRNGDSVQREAFGNKDICAGAAEYFE